MRLRTRLAPALASTVALTLAIACGASATPTPTPTPQSQSPTPTPVSPEARQAAREFAQEYERIAQDWDQFHRDFNQWRSEQISCDRSAAESALRGFAADFNEILRQARNLPRSQGTRHLADRLIAAAEGEGEVFRQLRDGWQPGNTALFSVVEDQRSSSSAAQQEVQDELSGSAESSDPNTVEEAQEFSEAFERVSADWQAFHDSYNSLRDQRADLSPVDMSSQLMDLVDQFGGIVLAMGNLPSSDTTRAMAEDLKAAAEAEEQALRDLRDNFQAQADSAAETSEDTGESSEDEAPSAEPPEGDDPFVTMNNLVGQSDSVREQVRSDLTAILEDTGAPPELGDTSRFRREYNALVREWDQFHREYDDWRRTEGGCNRSEVIEQLGEFSVRFGEIATRVRNLPPASFVRPMKETLVEAAEREEEALRVLRNTWRPFATDVYRALDQERTNAGRLRRDAEVSIQELLDRFGVPASEL